MSRAFLLGYCSFLPPRRVLTSLCAFRLSLDRDPLEAQHSSYYYAYDPEPMKSIEYDPWPSDWRKIVSEIVLNPSVNKTASLFVLLFLFLLSLTSYLLS